MPDGREGLRGLYRKTVCKCRDDCSTGALCDLSLNVPNVMEE